MALGSRNHIASPKAKPSGESFTLLKHIYGLAFGKYDTKYDSNINYYAHNLHIWFPWKRGR